MCLIFIKVKVKADIATPPQSYGTSRAIWDHTVLPATRHKWTRQGEPHPRYTGWYSIYLPGSDGRLSWPRWLDSAPAGSRTSDLSITSTTPNQCTTNTTKDSWSLLLTYCSWKVSQRCTIIVNRHFNVRLCIGYQRHRFSGIRSRGRPQGEPKYLGQAWRKYRSNEDKNSNKSTASCDRISRCCKSQVVVEWLE